jgi:primosomal protein N' (replication factor Y)
MLPPGMSQQVDSIFDLVQKKHDIPLSPLQRRIVAHLRDKGATRGAQFNRAFAKVNWKAAIRRLIQLGIVQSQAYLAPPRVQTKMVRTIHLNIKPEDIDLRLKEISKKGTAFERRREILRLLSTQPDGIESSMVTMATGATSVDLNKLSVAGFIYFGEIESIRDPLEHYEKISHDPPILTEDQQKNWSILKELVDKQDFQKPVLIHGVTGSGKTELYLQMVKAVLDQSKTAIVLVPEISLTPQTVKRFQARFAGKVGIIHSQISEGARFDTWRRIRKGELKVIVGPRSALFSPLENLGLIIVDEAHDDSYFQDDIAPRYNAIQAAEVYAKLNQALIVYGSATPGVEMMYKANQQKWPILRMPLRIFAHSEAVKSELQTGKDLSQQELKTLPLPEVSIIDMRRELKQGNRSIFSRELHQSIQKTLDAGYQAILFLNRRGSATYVFCRNCGFRLSCPRCDIPLTFHADQNHLLCHHCGYTRQLPTTCPQCKSNQIRQFGIGTERVEQEVNKQFPAARVIRMDSGISKQKGIHEVLLKQFSDRKADILVGTQMLAKGIDFPFVTLVGVILADVGLSMPDFRAAERTFQLLTQVAGRSGRSPLGGNAIFQTYQPDEYPIRMAAKHDFSSFYEHELGYRSKLGYPPFSRLIRLEFRHRDENEAKSSAQSMGEKIAFWIGEGNHKQTDIIGPVPCFFPKLNAIYRWQIVLRGPRPIEVLLNRELGETIVTVDPVSLL